MNLYKLLPAGKGKDVNKKQLQDFIKEILFEKTEKEITELLSSNNSSVLPAASAAVIKTLHEVRYSGDFSKFKPMLDFIFEKDLRARK